VNENRKIRAIILGAGRENPGQDGKLPPPRCLLTDSFGARVMDWILAALRSVDIRDITFVGGYRIEEIGDRYPDMNYIYNPDWERSGVLASLYQARHEIQGPTIVSYADIIYRPEVCKSLLRVDSDTVTIAVDSTWRSRHGVDVSDMSLRKNMVILSGDAVRDIGFLPPSYAIDGEFIGLVFFGAESAPLLKKFFNEEYDGLIGKPFCQAKDVRFGYLTDLLRFFLTQKVDIRAADIGGNWAEMDSPEQLVRFVLGTKGETLERLSSFITKGRFCEQRIYTVGEWESKPETILESIKSAFAPQRIVIRSSTNVEDSWIASHAGAFESILDIDPSSADDVRKAIERVVTSYMRGQERIERSHQILVQRMVKNVLMSGVVFTRDLETGAPYYVINYDDMSQRTDTVTSGMSNDLKTVLVSRTYTGRPSIARLSEVLEVVRELENVTGWTALDIEFAVDTGGNIYILQTRPLTRVDPTSCYEDTSTSKELESVRAFLRQRLGRVPYLFGETTILGDMPDWNPAEMIGTRPEPLALSLYHYLIMNSAWRLARARVGYNHPEPASLMVWLAGHPLIDVRCSFNSFIPAALSVPLKEKLVNHYIERLRQNPDMHDKVEFEVLFTCLDFDFDRQSQRLIEQEFTTEEVDELRRALLHITDNIVSGRVEPSEKLMGEIDMLNSRRQELLGSHLSINGIPAAVGQLCDDIITYGTIPFSILARYAFIGYSLLRSLVARGIVSTDEEMEFLQSVNSVATDMARDMNDVMNMRMPRERFLEIYGHLRPGTYDITSLRYDEAPDMYFPSKPETTCIQTAGGDCRHDPRSFEIGPKTRKAVEAAIKEAGFSFGIDQMFRFIAESISLRERAKFEFTKALSDVLVLIVRLGKEYGIPREELAFLDIEQVRLLGLRSCGHSLGEELQRQIERGHQWFEHGRRIKIPHLITKVEDIDVMALEVSRPNFVTQNKVTAQVAPVTQNTDPASLRGKIALIERSDPGYDWIFLHGIAGLITKYGGAASHMTIRAAEFEVPAAIGCGELLFDRLSKARVVELDCSGNRVHAL